MKIGTKNNLKTSIEVAESYSKLAYSNKKAGNLLFENKLYNEASYNYIQCIEKMIKEEICKKVNSTNPYFSEKLRQIGHSLDDSISFLIEILSGNNIVMREQIKIQLISGVLKNIRFGSVHNDLRYPKFNKKTEKYSIVQATKNDCEILKKIINSLEDYLREL